MFGSLELSAPPWFESNGSTATPALLCIRPEHLVESKAAHPLDTHIHLGTATVNDHAFFGAYQRCEVSVGQGQTLVLHLPQLSHVSNGAQMQFSVPASSIVLLPRE
jgi:hypothetical protein